MINSRTSAMLIGLFFIAVAVLIPPRQWADSTVAINGSSVPPRGFLLDTGNLYYVSPARVKIDFGRLVLEITFICVVSGAALLVIGRGAGREARTD